MRRLLLPFLLAVLCAASVAAAARVDADPAPPAPIGDRSPVTPVLSARRVPAYVAAPVADRRLRAALQDLVSRSPAATCLSVEVGGRTVFASNPDVPLVPASLEKLLTAVAALDVLGDDFTFQTRATAAAPPEGGVIAGDLYLVGGGDPLLETDAYELRYKHQPQIRTDFEALADAIVGSGVREIRGAVLGDESRYDQDRYPDAWPQRFIDQDQTGPLSALDVDDGFIAFPPNPDVTTPDEEPAPDPAAAAAAKLSALLVARGVTVGGGTGTGISPAGAVDIAVLQSPPLRDVIAEMLRESDNQTAELLTKELGLRKASDPSTAGGAKAVADVIAGLSLPVAGAVVEDGSGLGPGNRQTCALVQAALAQGGPQGTIADGLPIAGQTGTLDVRFVDTPVAGRLRAKTGTLNQSTGLAGFVDSVQGVGLTFSYVINVPAPERISLDHLALQDELGAILIRYPEGPALADLGPKPPPP